MQSEKQKSRLINKEGTNEKIPARKWEDPKKYLGLKKRDQSLSFWRVSDLKKMAKSFELDLGQK